MSNRTAFFMAIIATLRPVPAVAAGIVPVGSAAFSDTINFSSGTTQSYACALPAGCVAGDTAVFSCSGRNLGGFAWSAGSMTLVVASQLVSSIGLVCAVFAYKLTSADITAGSVSLQSTASATSWSVQISVMLDVCRGVDSPATDVVGSIVSGTFSSSNPSPVSIAGITTTQDGDMLQYAFFTPNPNSAGNGLTPPTGWTNGTTMYASYSAATHTGYQLQTTKGATGDQSASFLNGLGNPTGGYATVMLSLKAYNPTFRLTGTLPAATIGTAWTGVLNFAGDYTGTISIDASAGTIPAWMGTPVIDYTAKTVTWTAASGPGTGTDAGSPYAFTPRATSTGGQVAVGPGQSVVVSAAATADYFNPAKTSTDIVLSSGNSVATRGPAAGNWRSTLGVTSIGAGFKVFEVLVGKVSGTGKDSIGFADASANLSNYIGSDTHGWGYLGSTNGGSFYNGGSAKATSRGTWGTGDIVVCAIDASGNVWFGVNSAWINNGGTSDPIAGTRPALTGATGTLYAGASIFLAGDYLTLRVKSSEFTTPLAAACLAGGFSSLSGL